MFFQYYVVYILMFGGLAFYFVSRYIIKIAFINGIIILMTHILFIYLLIHTLENTVTGSFFDRAP